MSTLKGWFRVTWDSAGAIVFAQFEQSDEPSWASSCTVTVCVPLNYSPKDVTEAARKIAESVFASITKSSGADYTQLQKSIATPLGKELDRTRPQDCSISLQVQSKGKGKATS